MSKKEKLIALGLGFGVTFVSLEIILRISGMGYKPQEVNSISLNDEGKIVVLAVGDSMTYGIGSTTENDYPSQMERILGEEFLVVNAGMAGQNSAMILKKLPEYLSVIKPDYVSLLAGCANETNFIGYGDFESRTSFLSKVEKLLFKIRVFKLFRFGIDKAGSDQVFTDGMVANVESYKRWLNSQNRTVSVELNEIFNLIELNQYRKASNKIDGLIKKNPNNQDYYWAMGTVKFGLREDSDRWFLDCVRVASDNPACYFGLGEPYIDYPEYAQRTIDWFIKGIEADPHFAPNYWGLAMAQQRWGGGIPIDSFKKCIEEDPSYLRCYSNIVPAAGPFKAGEIITFLKPMANESKAAKDTLEYLESSPPISKWVKDDLQEMINLSHKAGAEVIVHEYPYWNKLNPVLREVADENAVPFVANYTRFQGLLKSGRDERELFIYDHTHCTDLGYKQMAIGGAEAIKALLKNKDE